MWCFVFESNGEAIFQRSSILKWDWKKSFRGSVPKQSIGTSKVRTIYLSVS